jgi:hypothetical protein
MGNLQCVIFIIKRYIFCGIGLRVFLGQAVGAMVGSILVHVL